MKIFNYEIYTKNPQTMETGWDIQFVDVYADTKKEAREFLSKWELFDEVILFNYSTDEDMLEFEKGAITEDGKLLYKAESKEVKTSTTIDANTLFSADGLRFENIKTKEVLIKDVCYMSHLEIDKINGVSAMLTSNGAMPNEPGFILSVKGIYNTEEALLEALKKEWIVTKLTDADFDFLVFREDNSIFEISDAKRFKYLELAREYAIQKANEYAEEEAELIGDKNIQEGGYKELYCGHIDGEIADIGYSIFKESYIWAEVLIAYKEAKGKFWRRELKEAWSTGNYSDIDEKYIPVLQKTRNYMDCSLESIKTTFNAKELAHHIETEQIPF